MDIRQAAVLLLAVGALLVSVNSQEVCSPGWFGSLCQYKCRCSNNNCTTEGACQQGVPCQKGWFGPACQYVDLAYNKGSPRDTTDGDDTTCLETSTPTYVTVALDRRCHVTWLRVHVSKPDFLYNLTVRFRQDASLSCTNTRTARVDNTTLDIHCDLKRSLKHVILSGEGVRYLCSVYISGGRNVALKQNSSQSSTYTEDSYGSFPSQLAVDGDSNKLFYRGKTCTHTLPGDSNPNLNISFSQPQRVTRYVLYNRVSEDVSYRLQEFELRSFGTSMTPVFNYTDTSSYGQQVYTVIPDQVTPPIRLVNVAVSKGQMILTLCELEIYGDSVCQPGQYGRECEHTCHCAEGQSCFVSTGGCPSGCAAGFLGQDCGTACDRGSYGPECQSSCSQFCLRDNDLRKDFCDNVNGTCLHGCQSGYQASTCAKRCDVGSYGPGCQLVCSQFCVRDGDPVENFCDNTNGTCLHGCQSGYQGSNCTERCDVGSHGPLCQHVCSQFCVRDGDPGAHFCDNTNGTCLRGCQSGYQGYTCIERCDVGSYGPECLLACSQFCDRDGDPGAHFCDITNGTCLHGCQSGYQGSNCTERCDVGIYGPGCQLACNQFCVRDGDPGTHFCDNTNGICLHGCQTGYKGSTCTQRCDVGSYGPGCQLVCSQFCVRDGDPGAHFCDNTNGTCLHGCQSGYQGSNCSERCDVGSYGPGCQLACSQFCVTDRDPGAHFCDNTNGTCLHGCQNSYLGSNCTEKLSSNDNVNAAAVVSGPVVVGVGVLVLVVVAVVFWRRRQTTKSDAHGDSLAESNDYISLSRKDLCKVQPTLPDSGHDTPEVSTAGTTQRAAPKKSEGRIESEDMFGYDGAVQSYDDCVALMCEDTW